MRLRLLAAGFLVSLVPRVAVAQHAPAFVPAIGFPPAEGIEAAEAAREERSNEPWVSLSGSGLISLPDVSTLPPGHLNLDFALENQDRDPVRLDVLDLSPAWTYGIGRRFETYGHLVVSRAVIVADRPTLFPPPVDVVIPQGAPPPSSPYYALFAPFPYVNRTGTSQLSSFSRGDALFGGKMRFAEPRGRHPGLAASAELKIPMTRNLANLQSGAGTGGLDVTGRITAEWRPRRESVVASLAFTHVGGTPFGDRTIAYRPEGEVSVADSPLRLAQRFHFGLGLRHVINPSVALVGEMTKDVAVGGHTHAFEAAGPLDLSTGGQLRRGRFHLTLCLRFHVNSVPFVSTHPSPFAGLADVTNVSAADLRSYLDSIGASGAAGVLRSRTQIALAIPAGGPPLPDGARVIPPTFDVKSHDRVAYVFVWGWSFGTASRKRVLAEEGASPRP
jgi:hypothetical protein